MLMEGGGRRVIPFPGVRPPASALEQIFLDHQKRLICYLKIRLGSWSEAEDVAQSAYLKLHNSRQTLHDGNLTALLFVTARNISTDILRKRVRDYKATKPPSLSNEAENVIDEAPNAERILISKQYISIVLKIIDELPEKCRISFISYKFDGLEYSEIAENLRVSESMIRKYVLKATAYCVQRFDQLEGWE